MKKLMVYACAAILMMSANANPAFAADSPWNGTWKVNQEKSKVTGNTFTITGSPNGKMHYSNGSTVSYDFACDGKDYPTVADRSFTCTRISDSTFDTMAKRHGETISTSHREISSDGKTMKIVTTGKRGDGSAFETTTSYARTTGKTGITGGWKSTNSTSTNMSDLVLSMEGDTLHSSYPIQKETIDTKLDGTYAPVVGPLVPPNVTMSHKAAGPRKIMVAEKLSGKPWLEGVMTLSADGKTMTDESWAPGKAAEKQTLVYEKQ